MAAMSTPLGHSFVQPLQPTQCCIASATSGAVNPAVLCSVSTLRKIFARPLVLSHSSREAI